MHRLNAQQNNAWQASTWNRLKLPETTFSSGLDIGEGENQLMCVLRLSGPYNELSSSVNNTFVEFSESVASRQDRERGGEAGQAEATFLYTVSDAGGDRVPVQIDDAVSFLTRHRDDMKALRSRNGVERAILDFAWDFPQTSIGQFNRFPLQLLKLCVELCLEIEVSVYAVSCPERRDGHTSES